MRARVITLFGLATLEDFGRAGRRKFGVPPGGAFDRESMNLANALLGNPPGSPVTEFSLGTMTLEIQEPGPVSVVGAASFVDVDGIKSAAGARFPLNKGATITIGPPKRGLRTYLALPGGVKAELVLGSVSGTTVEPGGEIVSVKDADRIGYRKLAEEPHSLRERPLRVIALSTGGWLNEEYEVSREINRVGLRLTGAKIKVEPSGTSEPSVIGAVQVTEDGTLIIHGPDGPTIGGYRKLGGVIRADLDRVGQLSPGDKIKFVKISVEEARELWRQDERRREDALQKISLLTKGT